MAQMGRPRQFDRNAALTTAMHLFWEHGYEATSLSRLKTALGISAPSFYAAFGSKEALFQEAVRCYLSTHGTVTDCLWDTGMAPRLAIETALRRSAAMQAGSGHPTGCMVVLGVVGTGCDADATLTAALDASRARTGAGMLACVERGIAQGELRPDTEPRALATVFESFLLGLTTLARDGVSTAAMDAAITQVMRLWDLACVQPQPVDNATIRAASSGVAGL